MKLIEYLKENGIEFTECDDNITVGGSLYLRGTAITSLPDNLTVCGYLYLRGTAITSLPDNLIVGGYLNLEETAITSLPDNLTVGGSLDLEGAAITSLPDNLTVGDSLYLRGAAITSLPDNLTVGDSLDLRGTAITSLPDNLIVGGSLDLEGTAITSLPDNHSIPANYVFTWQNGRYIKADRLFMEVISKKGNVYQVRKINKPEISFLITDGVGKWSHGATLKEAKEDLIFKINNRDKSYYENLTLGSLLTFEDGIEAYRVITGACSYGTRDFVKNRLESKKEQYSVAEIISLTKGEYGHNVFQNFFARV